MLTGENLESVNPPPTPQQAPKATSIQKEASPILRV